MFLENKSNYFKTYAFDEYIKLQTYKSQFMLCYAIYNLSSLYVSVRDKKCFNIIFLVSNKIEFEYKEKVHITIYIKRLLLKINN